MTMTHPDLALELGPALATAAAAATGALLVDPMLEVGEPGPVPTLAFGAKAVTAELSGPTGSGRLLILASPELAAAVQDGPLGPQSLQSAMDPVLSAAATALESSLNGSLRLEAVQVVEAEGVTADLAVPLLAGTDVAAAVALTWTPAGVSGTESPLDLPAFVEGPAGPSVAGAPLELLHDVEMAVTAELGRTRMTVRNLLGLVPGAIVELDRAAGSPVDLLVNGTLIARGEVVVVDDEYGIRVTEIVRRERPVR